MLNSAKSSKPVRRAAAAAVEQLEGRIFLYGATVGVDVSGTHQTMDGFGAAMATWKDVTGYSDAAFYDRIVNDLGATIARTAVWPTFEEGNDNGDSNVFNWNGYDPDALAQAMTFMKRLQDRGMENLLATVWAPPTYLRTNQTYYYGGTVRPDLRDEFAEYLAAVAISADRDFGVKLSHISPQNEPFFVQEFESATYTPEQMREVVRETMRKFAEEKLDTKLIVPEEMAKGERYQWYIDALMSDPETRNFPGAFGVHGAVNPHWDEIGDTVAPYPQNLWSTESHGHAQTIEGALAMAQDIWNALALADASAYLYWQWTESESAGDNSLMVNGEPAIKYHVAKHFYRYIRPGAVRIDATSTTERLRTLSFKDPNTGALTHVLFNNEDTEANVTIDVNGPELPAGYKAYRTRAGENHMQLENVAGGSQVKITLPANSIVTLYSGPDLQPVAATSGGPLPARQGLSDPINMKRLNKAAVRGNVGDVREWLSQGDDVNETVMGGYSALHAGAAGPYAGAVDVINELLSRGASTTQATTEGFTALHFAAMNPWTRGPSTETSLAGDKVRALSAGGADENARDNRGRTPLHWAAMMPKIADIEELTLDPVVIDALLDGGANVNATDDMGFTPLDYAVGEGNTAAASELKKRGGVRGDGNVSPPPQQPPPPPSDTTAPTVDVANVTPDPRDTAVSSIDVAFSEAVTGVDLRDFILMRNGMKVMPPEASLTKVNDTTYRVAGLAAATGFAGQYMLKLEKTGSGITDAAGNALASSESDNWQMLAGVGAPGQQFIVGTEGRDVLVVTESGGVNVVEINGIETPIDPGATELYIDALDGDDLIVVEVATAQKLFITGSTGNDTIVGGPRDDELSGGVGRDRILGGDGNDFILGGPHNDYLNGEGGDDTVLGGGGNDRIHGGSGSNWLIGMNGNDVLFGNPGVRDSISGNDGFDTAVDADDGTGGSEALDNIAGIEAFIRTT